MQAATITVIGTVGAGLLAMIGSLVGTALLPHLTRKAERREAADDARAAALRRLIPEILRASNAVMSYKDKSEIGKAMAFVAELDMWLAEEDWAVVKIAAAAALNTEDNMLETYVAAAWILPAWSRGELTGDEAAAEFWRRTGVRVSKTSEVN